MIFNDSSVVEGHTSNLNGSPVQTIGALKSEMRISRLSRNQARPAVTFFNERVAKWYRTVGRVTDNVYWLVTGDER